MKNAKILPEELVGKDQVILGYNDIYNGSLFIDYESDTIYLMQK